LAGIAMATIGAGAPVAHADGEPAPTTRHIVVRTAVGAAAPGLGALTDDPAVTAIDRDTDVPGIVVLTVRDAASVAGAVQRLDQRADVRWAAPERHYRLAETGDDPLLPQQWNLAAVRAPAAWTVGLGATAPPVAVLDSGVPAPNRDLDGALVAGPDGGPNGPDVDGHATAVAGVLGARTGDAFGLAGLAPAARILPLNVVDANGAITDTTVTTAITWAARAGAKIVNLSLTGPYSRAIDEALSAHPDVLFVAAAGNDGDDIGAAGMRFRPFPCGSDLDNVLCVGATGRNGAKTEYTNYGSGVVDVFAPGDAVLAPAFEEHDVFTDDFHGTAHGAWQVSGGTISGNGNLRVTPSSPGTAVTVRTKISLPVANSDCVVSFLPHHDANSDPYTSAYLDHGASSVSYDGGMTTGASDQVVTFSTPHLTHDAWLGFSNSIPFGIDDVKVHCRFPGARSERQTTVSGTSFSAPLVAAAADLLSAGHPGLAPAQLSAAIVCSATPGAGTPDSGILDAAATVDAPVGAGRAATAGKVAVLSDQVFGNDPQLAVVSASSAWDADTAGLSHYTAAHGWSLVVPDENTSTGDGGPATNATVSAISAVRPMPDGGVVFGDGNRLRRIWSDDHIDTVAGGFVGELWDVAPGDDGNYAVVDYQDYNTTKPRMVVDRVAADGTITQVRVAGQPPSGTYVAAEPGGAIAIADQFRILRVAHDGTTTVIAGDGLAGPPTGDGGPATAGHLGNVTRLISTPLGLLVGLDDERVRIVEPDGTITRYAGTGGAGTPIDGVAATATPLTDVQLVGRDATGTLLTADAYLLHVSDAQITAPDLPPSCPSTPAGGIQDDGAGPGATGAGDGGNATAAPAPPRLATPPSVVAATGTARARGKTTAKPPTTRLVLSHGRLTLRLTLSQRSRVVVRCTGHGCTARRQARTLNRGSHTLTLTTRKPRPQVTVAIAVGSAKAQTWRLRAGKVRRA
jgi:thermitase